MSVCTERGKEIAIAGKLRAVLIRSPSCFEYFRVRDFKNRLMIE